MRHVSAILLAAGRGARLNSNTSKPLLKIGSQPIIIYCLKTLNKHPYIKDIVVVVNPGNKEAVSAAINKYKISKVRGVILGARRRQDSVQNGLKAMASAAEYVLIHDGVRPFIDKDTVTKVIKEAARSGAAVVGVPMKATIKEVTRSGGHRLTSKFVVKKTLERIRLWEIQTPQVFKKALILEAYKKFGDIDVTDDAMLAEKLGATVSMVLGSYNNIKITTPEDLVLAKAIAKKWNTG